MRRTEDKTPLILYVGTWRKWAVSFIFQLLKQWNSLRYPLYRRPSGQQSRLWPAGFVPEHPQSLLFFSARNKVPHFYITTGTLVYCNLRFLHRRLEDVSYSQHNGGKHSTGWICPSCLSLLGCGISSFGGCFPTFRDDLMVSYLRVEISAVNCIVSINLSCYFAEERRGRVSGNSVPYSGVPGFKSEIPYVPS